MEVEFEANDADIFSGCGNGTLDVDISHDLDVSGKSWNESKGDRHLDICINDEDLHYIRLDMFRFVVGKPAELEGYFIKRWKDSEAQQILTEFPLLSRIRGMYYDALYKADEVTALREECVRLKSATTNSSAELGLRKLIYSCDEALKVGLCLGMWCD